MINDEVLELARKVWNYHQLNHIMVKSDCILALGSHDLRVADRACDLYEEGWAPLIVFSGGLGNLTQGVWTEPEADKFAAIAMSRGIPASAILIENKSTNTGENIRFSKRLLAENGLDPQSFIVVQKPYMERRSYATFKKHWPNKDLLVTSPQLSFDQYHNTEIPLEKVIHIMVGDLQRIKYYPDRGFQVPQDIPDEVWDAYQQLVERGFNKHLIRD
ncbi:YdcF family protein [Flavihumibacter sediminis]|nr:YdcF family protein [Flavihumibacter sediminis]